MVASTTTPWLNGLGQKIAIAGVVQSPVSVLWNFVSGVTAAYNTDEGRWDLTVSGGGGGAGHTIEDEGVALTARTSLNFVGVNVSVADSGGKTVVTIGAVSLAGSQVTGTLPVARGGTGLGALGTALQAIRVNAAATALEYYTPAAGLTVPGGDGFRFTYSTTTTDADPGAGTFRFSSASYATAGTYTMYVDLAEFGATDVTAWLDSLDDRSGSVKGRIRVVSIADPTKWVVFNLTGWTTATGYRKLTVAYVAGPGGIGTTAGDTFVSYNPIGFSGTIATADITDENVTYAKIQNVSAASRVLLRGSAGGAGDVEEGTCGVGVRINGTAIELSAALAPLATLGTALQQVRVNSGATALEYFSPPSPVDGGNLTNANVTKNISDGSQFTLPTNTLGSSNKTLTLGTSGTPEDGEIIEVIVYSQTTYDFILKDGGAIGDNLYTVAAGTKRVLHAQWSSSTAAWRPAGKIRLT